MKLFFNYNLEWDLGFGHDIHGSLYGIGGFLLSHRFFVCSIGVSGYRVSHASCGWELMNMGFNPLDKFRFLFADWCGESAANEAFASSNIFCLVLWLTRYLNSDPNDFKYTCSILSLRDGRAGRGFGL